MSSIMAEKVAQEVLDTVGRGLKPSVVKIAVKHGYSPKTAGSGNVQATLTYQAKMNEAISKMEKIRNKALQALDRKDLSKEDVRVLKELSESLTKQVQLLSGKATENIATTINVVSYSDQQNAEIAIDTPNNDTLNEDNTRNDID